MRVVSRLLVSLIIIFTVITQPATATAPQHGPAASGTGEFHFFTGVHTSVFSLSFDTQANKNGHATGLAEFDNLTDLTQVVVRINCLNVTDGTAVMSGSVLHSDDPNLPKSTRVEFAATDFALSPVFGSDTITPLFALPTGFDCNDGPPLTILPLDSGHVSITP